MECSINISQYMFHLLKTPTRICFFSGYNLELNLTLSLSCTLYCGHNFFRFTFYTENYYVSKDDLQIPKYAGPPREVSDPDKKKISKPQQSRTDKKIYIYKFGKTFNYRVTRAWSERVNLYNRQIKIHLRKKKKYVCNSDRLWAPYRPARPL